MNFIGKETHKVWGDSDMDMDVKTEWGMTAGCWDWMHIGHESLLSFCRKHCQKLVVIVHDDSAIRTLKKVGTVQPLEERIRNVKMFCDEVIVVKGTDCRAPVNQFLSSNPTFKRCNSFFARGNDNIDFPNRKFFEGFTNVRLLTYYPSQSSTKIRNLSPESTRMFFMELKKYGVNYAITGQDAVAVMKGRTDMWPIKITVFGPYTNLPSCGLLFKYVFSTAKWEVKSSEIFRAIFMGNLVNLI